MTDPLAVHLVSCSGSRGAQLELRRRPAGPPKSGQVLVRMEYSPINPADALRLAGTFGPLTGEPIAGGEGAGVVVRVGAEVDALAPGDPVALPYGGTWARELVVAADRICPLPAGVDLCQASMLGINGLTPELLLDEAALEPGDWLIQNAANSTVGKLLIASARRRGVRTVNVVRRPEVRAELESLGAHLVLVDGEDLAARLAQALGDERPSLALDAVAGEAAGRLLACLKPGGHLCCYGMLGSTRLDLPATPVAFRGVTVRGFSRYNALTRLGHARTCERLAALAARVRDQELQFDIEHIYPLDEVVRAMEHAAQGGRRGKIMLRLSA